MVFPTVATGTSGNGGQYSSRNGEKPKRCVIHHAASGSRSAVLSMMSSGSREVSANVVIDGDEIIGVVPEEFSSWSLAAQSVERSSLTAETVNSATGDASGWPISEASYRSLARWVADCASRYGFPINRTTVIGHLEVAASYPTACPGGIDLDRVVRDALDIQRGTPAAAPTVQEDDMYMVRLNENNAIYLITSNGYRHVKDIASVQGWEAASGQKVRQIAFVQFMALVTDINALNRADSALLGDDDYKRIAAEVRNAEPPKAA